MQWVIAMLCLVIGLTLIYISVKGNGAALFNLVTKAGVGTGSATAAPADAEGVAAGNAGGAS